MQAATLSHIGMWSQHWWLVSSTVQEMQCGYSVICKMVTLLNELTREEVRTNNAITVGPMEPIVIHSLTVVVYSTDVLSSNMCRNGSATEDGWESVMKTNWPSLNTSMFVT